MPTVALVALSALLVGAIVGDSFWVAKVHEDFDWIEGNVRDLNRDAEELREDVTLLQSDV